MAGPAVIFTNNLGSIQFERCLIGIADNWNWNGRAVKHTKSISVSGHFAQADEGFEGVLTDQATSTDSYGEAGQLALPWTILSGIKIQSLNSGNGTWVTMVPIQAAFLDGHPDDNDNIYTLHFFGLEVHNPRLRITLPHRQVRDDYPQMPIEYGTSINPLDLRFGAMRTRQNEGLVDINLSGSILIDGGQLPENFVGILSQRIGMESVTNYAGLPAGYPNVFEMSDAVPELAGEMSLSTVFVARSRATWNVEQGSVQVQIQMRCQPQELPEA